MLERERERRRESCRRRKSVPALENGLVGSELKMASSPRQAGSWAVVVDGDDELFSCSPDPFKFPCGRS